MIFGGLMMNFNIVFFVVTCYAFKSATGYQKPKTTKIIDNLLNKLARETWDPEEIACLTSTEDILKGVKNNTLWATWVWDSMQLPVGTLYGTSYHLGNFDQCLSAPWSEHVVQTQYCLVDVEIASLGKHDETGIQGYDAVERYISAKFQHGKRLHSLSLGVCLPASCSPGSTAKITKHIFSLSHLPFIDVTVDPRDCQIAGSSVEKPIGFYVLWLITLSLVFLCVAMYFLGNSLEKSNSFVSKLAGCFCLTRNFNALAEVSKDEIKVIRGIKVLSCGMLVVAHSMFMSQSTLVNQMDLEKILDSAWQVILHSDLFVDTFFVMSGLLHFRALMASRSFQPFMTVLKRYLRLLLPLYVMGIASMAYVEPYLGSGPLWPRTVRKHFEPCTKSWWRNFLMITNKVDGTAVCFAFGWHVICDFHLTVLGTAIFMMYRKNKRVALMFSLFSFVFSLIVPAVTVYRQGLPGILWYDFRECMDMEVNKVYRTVYVPFYNKANPYLIGLALGYVMAVHKPQRNKIISKATSVIGFITGMSLLWLGMKVGAKMFKNEFGPIAMAAMSTLDKTIWSSGICLIIIVCEYGTLPIINDLLSSRVFVPLSKLTFSVYLRHIVFINLHMFSLRTLMTFDMFGVITTGLGYAVVTFSACYLLWLFVEAPVNNVVKLLLDINRNTKAQKDCGREVHHKITTKAATD